MIASTQHAATLPGAVRHVLPMRPDKQMLGTAARRMVAGVTDTQALTDRAVRQLPRDAVSEVDPITPSNQAVAVFIYGSGPRPTPFNGRAIDPRPEAVDELVGNPRMVRERSGSTLTLVVPIAQTSSQDCVGTVLDAAPHVNNPSRTNHHIRSR